MPGPEDAGGRPGAARMALVLAAGSGRRMGTPKALLEIAGVPLPLAIARRYEQAGIRPTLVVVSDEVRAALEPFGAAPADGAGADEATVEWIAGADPAAPMMDSVRRGLRRAIALGAAAVFVQPVDSGPPAVAVLARLEQALGGRQAAKPTYKGRGGHPLLLSAAACAAVLRAAAPTLRAAVAGLGAPLVARVEVDDPGVLANWNVPGDLPARGGDDGPPSSAPG